MAIATVARNAAKAPQSVDVHIGQRLRSRRIALGQSQTALGAALGVTHQQIQKYEVGQDRIAASRLYEAACAQDVPVAWYFEDYAAAKIEAT